MRAFKKIGKISRQLDRKDKLFYEKVYKYKAFSTRANFIGCKLEI